jgi:hypothetical protein
MEISAIGKLLSAAVSVGTDLRASKRNFCSIDEGAETVPLRFNRLFAETSAYTGNPATSGTFASQEFPTSGPAAQCSEASG